MLSRLSGASHVCVWIRPGSCKDVVGDLGAEAAEASEGIAEEKPKKKARHKAKHASQGAKETGALHVVHCCHACASFSSIRARVRVVEQCAGADVWHGHAALR